MFFTDFSNRFTTIRIFSGLNARKLRFKIVLVESIFLLIPYWQIVKNH